MRRLPLFALMLLASGCLGPRVLRSEAPAQAGERREYAAAVGLLPGDPEGAIAGLDAFLEAHPRSPLADDAAVRLARLLVATGEPEAAMEQLAWVVRSHASGDRADSARLLLARLHHERGQTDEAARVMAKVRFSRLSADEVPLGYRLAARIAGDAGDRVAQLRWLSQMRLAVSEEEALAAVDAQIDALLPSMTPEDLDRAARELGRRTPAGRVMLQLAEGSLDRGDAESARKALERAGRLPLSGPEAERFAAIEARLSVGQVVGGDATRLPTFAQLASASPPDIRGASGTVGVVLPLSGSMAAFGEECLRGILLAAEIFDAEGLSTGSGNSLRLRVSDSEGTAAGAAAAVRELADDDSVLAILGPLVAAEAEGAAAAAQEEGIPLLALTAREEVARARSRVFRLGPSPRSSVQVLAGYAIDELGARRFAILYPRDSYGRGHRDLFWDAVEEEGGRVVGVGSYDPDATDFAQAIRGMIGFELLSREEREALVERDRLLSRAKRAGSGEAAELRQQAAELTGPGGGPLPPVVDFEALFIADAHGKVELIAPALAFHEVSQVHLLGPNGWNHPDLLRIAGRHLEGAVFAETFHKDSRFPAVVDFTRRYRNAYGADPGPLAAQAFDAANLVLVQLAEGRNSREAVRQGVLGVSGYPGVAGITSMLPDGNAQKRPYLLGVVRREIVPLD